MVLVIVVMVLTDGMLKTEVMMPFRFDQEVSNQAVNDIFAILSNKKGYWLGTSFGLTHMQSPGNYRVYNEADGFPNNTVTAFWKMANIIFG